MPYDPFDFDDGDGYALVPVDQAWPQVPPHGGPQPEALL